MSWDLVTSDVSLHGALPEEEARSVAMAVTEELGGAFLDADRRELPRLAPDWLAHALGRGTFRGEIDDAALYRRVADRLALDEARALEITKLVASAITHRTEASAITALKTHLPPSIAALFVDRPDPSAAPLKDRASSPEPPGEGHTLSSGRPGSYDSVATGRPSSKHPVSTDD